MNKTVLLALLSVLALAVHPLTVSAQGDHYPDELAYYDAQINVLLPRLDEFQSQYYAVNGRYYQALTSHEKAPEVPTVPDKLDASPTDQPEALAYFWDKGASLPDQLAWSLRIDTYTAPLGSGYVLTIETIIDGETWQRSINRGPSSEDWRAYDWTLISPQEF